MTPTPGAQPSYEARLHELYALGYAESSPEIQGLKNAMALGAAAAPVDCKYASCFKCGVLCEANEYNVCGSCLQQTVDVRKELPAAPVVRFCKSCGRFEHCGRYIICQPESPELLALCLKNLKLPKSLKIVSADFVWTEPHSRRLKVRLSLEKQLLKVFVRQMVVVEFVEKTRQCPDCTKSVTPHIWVHQVQVRQRLRGARGTSGGDSDPLSQRHNAATLQKLALRRKALAECTSVATTVEGVDFNFQRSQDAAHFLAFCKTAMACKVHGDNKQQVSHNASNNSYHNKYVTLVELPHVNRDDLVVLPKGAAQRRFDGAARVLLCREVGRTVKLADVESGRVYELDADAYWKDPLQPTLSRRQLEEFMVCDAVKAAESAAPADVFRKKPEPRNELYLVELLPLRPRSDFERRSVLSRVGAELTAGSIALGYDFRRCATLPDDVEEQLRSRFDVLLVGLQKAKKARKWLKEHAAAPCAPAADGASAIDVEQSDASVESLLDQLQLD